MGYTKTAILMAAMTALFLGVGYLLAGVGGIVVAFLIAAAMNAFSWYRSDKLVLRMHNAEPVVANDSYGLHRMVADLARKANMPMPAVYLIDEGQPNAFATGRNPQNAAVAVTEGLLGLLTRDQVAAVVAHELAHIKNHDTAIMTVTATFAGAISMLANICVFFFSGDRERLGVVGTIAMMVLAPIAAALVQMAISRSREYEADRIGAEICGHPMWLAEALERIQGGASVYGYEAAERHPATAHMFIINPLLGGGRDKLFSTHPSTENRIEALRQLAENMPRPNGSSFPLKKRSRY